MALFDLVIARSAFPPVASDQAEAAKIDAVRIAVGSIMLYRTALIVIATYYYHPTDVAEAQITAKFLLGCGMLALLGAYMIGLCTPISGLALILAYPYFDLRLLTGTLGTNVASICLITLLLLNAGRHYSIDNLVLKRDGAIAKLWRGMYGVLRFPDATQTVRIYFLAFAAYGIISFSALAYHLNDAYWREGRTVGVMLTSAYLSRYYEFFRVWEAATPGLYRAFSIACVAGQTVFQAAMLPLMFAKWGRRFVVAWGLMFFAISLLCLQLSYLPYLELALWTLLFARVRGQSETQSVAGQHLPWTTTYTAAIATAFVVFLITWFAPAGRAWSGDAWERPQRILAWAGLDAPQVFNEADLQMGERWPVIYRVSPSGERERVPLNGDDGERLAYHHNDLLYFGNSLRWHRRMIASDPRVYNAEDASGYRQIREVCYYDYARAARKPTQYEIRIYENQSAQPNVPSINRYTATEILSFNLTPDMPPQILAQRDVHQVH